MSMQFPWGGEFTMKSRYIFGVFLAVMLGTILLLAGCTKNSVGDDEVVDDGIAPAVITDLSVASFTDTSITLTWTASGDDSTSGIAANYDLRISNETIHWANFDSTTQIMGLPAPKPAGQTEQFTVSGLTTDSTYYFSLRVTDENGNFNGASNCVHATCFNDFAVTIPDVALRAVLRSKIGKPTGDILKSDLIDIYDLLAEDESIADLTGLEYCTNMAILNIINNAVDDLTPLSQLDNLQQLHAAQNNIADIEPLAGLTGMLVLNLKANHIVELDSLSALIHLTDLNLQNNDIVDVSVLSAFTDLAFLDLSYNGIRDITPLINNAGLGSGDIIGLVQNPLLHESIMTHIPALRARGATVNWIDNFFPPGNVNDLTVDTVTATTVTLSWTAPGEDYDAGIAYRYEIRYSTDQSVVANWTGGESASGLPAPDTAGTAQTVVISGLTEDSTYYFALRTQDNSENWSATSNVVWGKPYADIIVTFVDPFLEAAVRAAISKPTGDMYKSELATMDSLIADNYGITDLTGLEHCVNLGLLHLINNSVSDVTPLAGLIGLTDLNLQGNNVTDISPLSSLENLGALQLTGNPLSSLTALSSLDNLWLLAISLVGVNDLEPLASLTNLNYLFASSNNITNITPLGDCTHLKYLNADNNSISNLSPLGGLVELNTLSLKSNQVQDISPLVTNSGLTDGDIVALEYNPLSTVSIDTYIPALEGRGVTVTY